MKDCPDSEYAQCLCCAISAKRTTRYLKYFNNDVRMEALFRIWRNQDDPSVGMSEIIASLSTSPKTDSGMQLFLREMIALGCFAVTHGDKASKKHLSLSDGLATELRRHVIEMLQTYSSTDPDVHLVTDRLIDRLATEH